MKNILFIALLLGCTGAFAQQHKTENVILVTFDGYRWQDLFTGADKKLINYTKLVKDTGKLKSQYWAETPEARRMRLMPLITHPKYIALFVINCTFIYSILSRGEDQ